MPFDGAFPTLIQWPERSHPADRIADLGRWLHRLEIAHPRIDLIKEMLSSKFEDGLVTLVEASQTSLREEITTPTSIRELT
jgi:hypothetical protein